MRKAGLKQPLLVVVDQDRAGYAADVGKQIARDLDRKLFLKSDVAHREPTAGFEHARDLAKHGLFVRSEIDDAVADHAINRVIREG